MDEQPKTPDPPMKIDLQKLSEELRQIAERDAERRAREQQQAQQAPQTYQSYQYWTPQPSDQAHREQWAEQKRQILEALRRQAEQMPKGWVAPAAQGYKELPIVRVDRSRIVARHDCQMLRYWNYHHGGLGIVPRGGAGDALEFGIALHRAMEYILTQSMESKVIDYGVVEANVINLFCKTVYDRMLLREGAEHSKADHISKEQAHLLRMLVMGWAAYRLPTLREEYDIVGVETEYEVPFDNGTGRVNLMLRADAVLRRRADGVLHILDFKTLKYLSDDWMVHHENSLQTLLYLWALGKASGEYIGGVLYEGLLKGGTRKETNKSVPWTGWEVAQSPLCYVYTDGMGHYKHAWTSAKGWKKVPLFDRSWADVMAILHGSYLEAGESTMPFWNSVPPVRPTDAQVKQVVEAVGISEDRWDILVQDIAKFFQKGERDTAETYRKRYIEQNLGRCYKYGSKYGCPYTSICHGGADPDDETLWVQRTPHHNTETGEEPEGEAS